MLATLLDQLCERQTRVCHWEGKRDVLRYCSEQTVLPMYSYETAVTNHEANYASVEDMKKEIMTLVGADTIARGS